MSCLLCRPLRVRVYVVTFTAQSTFCAHIGTVILSPCKQWNNVSLQMSTLYTHIVLGDYAVTQAMRVVTAVTISISYFLQHYAAYGTHWMSYLFVRLLFPPYNQPFAFCCNISYVYLIAVLHSPVCYLNCALFRSCVSFHRHYRMAYLPRGRFAATSHTSTLLSYFTRLSVTSTALYSALAFLLSSLPYGMPASRVFCCNISYFYLFIVLHSPVCDLNCAFFRSCVSFVVTTVRHACLQDPTPLQTPRRTPVLASLTPSTAGGTPVLPSPHTLQIQAQIQPGPYCTLSRTPLPTARSATPLLPRKRYAPCHQLCFNC
jgi:hypothetical protein